VREAGDRAKVAVFSRERDVDPVGACVGMKGTRVQSIIRELRGEKIDIVEWSEDPVAFVTNALSPAKVQRVSIVDDRERVMEVIVEDKQLSLAIGKKGQNVRLASQLTGWRIDIHAESKVKELEEHARRSMAEIEGSSDELAGTLFKLGWRSAEEVARANVQELGGVPGVGGEQGAERLKVAAAKQVEVEKQRKVEQAERDRQAAEEAKRQAAEQAANPTPTANSVDAGWTEEAEKR
jgi:N utilization substance protein A